MKSIIPINAIPKKNRIFVGINPTLFKELGRSSIKDRYIIAPADRPRKKLNDFLLNSLIKRNIRLPIRVDIPARKARSRGI